MKLLSSFQLATL